MSNALAIAFLFFIGALLGWCLEFLYRNLISHNGPRGEFFINPGFCHGPYLPIYGIGLSVMCAISYTVTSYIPDAPAILVILVIAFVMVAIEFIGGLFLLKVLNLRLWDYRDRPGNFMGIVCPLFSLIWGGIGAVYYLFIHKYAIGWIQWLANNLAFSFFIGLFFGFFIIDMCLSGRDAAIIKQFGDDHDIIVKYEELKALMQKKRKEDQAKSQFFNQINSDSGKLDEILKANTAVHENAGEAFKSRRGKNKKRKNKGK